MTYNPVNPAGRLRRLAYAPTLVLLNLSIVGVGCLPSGTAATKMASVLATLFVVWVCYCTWSKRLHDAGRSSLLAAINIVLVSTSGIILNTQSEPALGYAAIAMLSMAIMIGGYLLVAPPTAKAIKYGPDPRKRGTRLENDNGLAIPDHGPQVADEHEVRIAKDIEGPAS